MCSAKAGVSVTIPVAEFLVGDEAVRLLRAIRQAYYSRALISPAFICGTAGADQDDGLRFMRAYESLMCAVNPKLHARIMEGGAHSEPVHYTLEVP